MQVYTSLAVESSECRISRKQNIKEPSSHTHDYQYTDSDIYTDSDVYTDIDKQERAGVKSVTQTSTVSILNVNIFGTSVLNAESHNSDTGVMQSDKQNSDTGPQNSDMQNTGTGTQPMDTSIPSVNDKMHTIDKDWIYWVKLCMYIVSAIASTTVIIMFVIQCVKKYRQRRQNRAHIRANNDIEHREQNARGFSNENYRANDDVNQTQRKEIRSGKYTYIFLYLKNIIHFKLSN